jgi:F0F1-type ATP synthase assembly protein I
VIEGQPTEPERNTQTNETPDDKRSHRFIAGFVIGAFLGFLEALVGDSLIEAAVFAVICGTIIGGIGAIWGRRALDSILHFLSR